MVNHRFAIAPMLDWTDQHCRYFLRLISRFTLLYTEMVTVGAILHGPRERLLQFHPAEHPVVLQLGGSEPGKLAECAKIAVDYGYDEVNLNVGCPSDRVQSGRFGACLMVEPELVAECVAAMGKAVTIPITVKTRIGIDERDSYEELVNFIEKVSNAGCKTFIIHARKAWLKGLSPKENREIPPLRYETVYQLKQDFPQLEFVLNGGVTDLAQIKQHLLQADGVMVGRAAYHNPYLLAQVDHEIFGYKGSIPTREDILAKYQYYLERQRSQGVPVSVLLRPIMGLYLGQPGARLWRRSLSEQIATPNAHVNLLKLKNER